MTLLQQQHVRLLYFEYMETIHPQSCFHLLSRLSLPICAPPSSYGHSLPSLMTLAPVSRVPLAPFAQFGAFQSPAIIPAVSHGPNFPLSSKTKFLDKASSVLLLWTPAPCYCAQTKEHKKWVKSSSKLRFIRAFKGFRACSKIPGLPSTGFFFFFLMTRSSQSVQILVQRADTQSRLRSTYYEPFMSHRRSGREAQIQI